MNTLILFIALSANPGFLDDLDLSGGFYKPFVVAENTSGSEEPQAPSPAKEGAEKAKEKAKKLANTSPGNPGHKTQPKTKPAMPVKPVKSQEELAEDAANKLLVQQYRANRALIMKQRRQALYQQSLHDSYIEQAKAAANRAYNGN